MSPAQVYRRRRPAFLGGLVLFVAAPAGARDDLPRKASLIAEFQKLGLTPRAQGERDTCSLFAITALAEYACSRQAPQTRRHLSEEFLIWAGNAASGLKGDQAMFFKAVNGLNAYGICAEEAMPYANTGDPLRRPSKQALADARTRSERWKVDWIRRWNIERPLTDAEFLHIKTSLAEGVPVACGFRWPKTMTGHEILAVPPRAKVFDGHSVVLVGYEDGPGKNGGGFFSFRNSAGPRWGEGGYGIMSYAYARAYANDAVALHYEPPHAEVPTERFEAESMKVIARRNCATNPQNMNEWGGRLWSKGEQLMCAANQGGFVVLGFTVRQAGTYRLRVLATAAPDFGRVRMMLDGRQLPPEFDLYCGQVAPAGSLELGTHELSAGPHRLRVTAIGKNAASANFHFGLDAVDLIASR